MIRFLMAFAASAVVLSACGASGPTTVYGQTVTMILEVHETWVPCVGEMAGVCPQVRELGEETWLTFYDTIQGFEPEEGTRYTIEVERREVLNPPADGSAFEYTLLRIIEQETPAG
ncbi:MAG: DUF4377 domain-containing protein [Gemmatimonadetes bacterium]|nr:DUF4377 domain-containing protein [Gemmatimonadota bacterium]